MRAGRYPEDHPLETEAREKQAERVGIAGTPDSKPKPEPAPEPRKRW